MAHAPWHKAGEFTALFCNSREEKEKERGNHVLTSGRGVRARVICSACLLRLRCAAGVVSVFPSSDSWSSRACMSPCVRVAFACFTRGSKKERGRVRKKAVMFRCHKRDLEAATSRVYHPPDRLLRDVLSWAVVPGVIRRVAFSASAACLEST